MTPSIELHIDIKIYINLNICHEDIILAHGLFWGSPRS